MHKNFSFGVKRLIGSVDSTLKSWKSIGGEPTLPDVASKIDEWGQDISALDNFDESITPAFQSAKAAIHAAWNVRDDRKKAIASLSNVLNALLPLNPPNTYNLLFTTTLLAALRNVNVPVTCGVLHELVSVSNTCRDTS